MNSKSTEKFQDTALNDTNDDTGTTMYDTIIVDIFLIHLSKSIECVTPRVKLNVNMDFM